MRRSRTDSRSCCWGIVYIVQRSVIPFNHWSAQGPSLFTQRHRLRLWGILNAFLSISRRAQWKESMRSASCLRRWSLVLLFDCSTFVIILNVIWIFACIDSSTELLLLLRRGGISSSTTSHQCSSRSWITWWLLLLAFILAVIGLLFAILLIDICLRLYCIRASLAF